MTGARGGTWAWLALASCLVGAAAGCAASEPSSAEAPSAAQEPGLLRAADREAIAAEVRRVLDEQVAAWNRGDVEAFMEGYWRSPAMLFVSGGTIRRGWDETLERYRTTYPDRAAMGTLDFEEVEVEVLSADAALVWGVYRLKRAADEPRGRFTLVFRNLPSGLATGAAHVWRIVHDHTSAAD